MPQDHTLIHLLHRSPTEIWAIKARWIESLGGMILTLVHPDYCGSGHNLNEYETLIKELSEFQSAWRALPSEVSSWWRRRDQMKLTIAATRRRSKDRVPSARSRGCSPASRWRVEVNAVARFLMIAYTTYMHDGRVKRHAEALAERGDHVDVICLATGEKPITNGVNVIGLPMPRYRGESKSAYFEVTPGFFRWRRSALPRCR